MDTEVSTTIDHFGYEVEDEFYDPYYDDPRYDQDEESFA